MALGKKTLYFTIPANLCLFSYIGYVFYSTFNEPDINLPIESPIVKLKVNNDTNTYNLTLNYPDPFLKEETKNRPRQTSLNQSAKKPLVNLRPKNTPPVVPIPSKEIRYLGLIQNKSSGITTALISINGKSYIIKKGEVIEGVNFLSITDEVIIAKIGKEKLTINRS